MTAWVIACDAVTDLRRRWVLIGLVIAAVLICLYFIGTLAMLRRAMGSPAFKIPSPTANAPTTRQTLDLMTSGIQTALYGSISFFGALAALFTFCTFLSAEQGRRTLRIVLSKPVRRYQFLLGKWLGGVMLLAMYCLIMSVVLLGNAYLASGAVTIALCYSLGLLFCKLVLVGSVAMVVSLLMPPPVAGILAYFAGAESFFWMARHIGTPIKEMLLAIYWILPSYSRFNLYSQFFTNTTISGRETLLLAAYAAVYCAILLWLALVFLRRRDLA